jgi:nucleotide-binding universal stress UspA family protein
MKTVIVPVDFSPTSYNSARYAVKMVTGTYDVNLVLFHVYEKESEEEEAYFLLEKLKTELSEQGIAKITCHAELGNDFPEALTRFARHRAAQLIVMGLNGKTKLEQIFLTSNTLKIVDKNPCPVMIIPPSADFGAIKNIALTSDFKDVDSSIPIQPIKAVLEIFRPQLHIVNVDSEHYVSLTAEYLKERAKLAEMFQEFRPEFYFIGTFDFHDTINQFVADKKIDMVITIPRNRSFIDNLFKPSNTKKLVFESTIPVLAAHE